MEINIDDIISLEMECKFYYKECEVTVKKINNFVSLSILGVSDKGYVLNKFRTFKVDQKKINQCVTDHANTKLKYVKKLYREVKLESENIDQKIVEFK